jgi:hypothetical protein
MHENDREMIATRNELGLLSSGFTDCHSICGSQI